MILRNWGYIPASIIMVLNFWSTISMSTSAYSQNPVPVALAIEVIGSSNPPMSAFEELLDGARIDLGVDGLFQFMHYERCEDITITGGILSVSFKGFSQEGGKITSRKPQPCPQKINVGKTSSIAGLVMRGGEKVTKIPLKPKFVITGSQRGIVDRIKILQGDNIILDTNILNRALPWPKETPSLISDTTYELQFSRNDGYIVSEIKAKAWFDPFHASTAMVLIAID